MHAIVEARRAAPAILYLPHLTLWWDTAPASLRSTLWMLLADLPPDLPLLFFATADAPLSEIPHDALALFGRDGASGAHQMGHPSAVERAAMFGGVALQAAQPSKPRVARIARQPLPEVRPVFAYRWSRYFLDQDSVLHQDSASSLATTCCHPGQVVQRRRSDFKAFPPAA